MIEVNKETISNFLMEKSLPLTQNPRFVEATRKVIELRNVVNSRIDATVKRVAHTLHLVVDDDIYRTNHALRGVRYDVSELVKTVNHLRTQLRESEEKNREHQDRIGEYETALSESKATLEESGAKIREYEARLRDYQTKLDALQQKEGEPPYMINPPVREA